MHAEADAINARSEIRHAEVDASTARLKVVLFIYYTQRVLYRGRPAIDLRPSGGLVEPRAHAAALHPGRNAVHRCPHVVAPRDRVALTVEDLDRAPERDAHGLLERLHSGGHAGLVVHLTGCAHFALLTLNLHSASH